MKKITIYIILATMIAFGQAFSIRPIYDYNLFTGSVNTSLGYASLPIVSTGEKNTSLGAWSGYVLTGTSNNTFLGYASGASAKCSEATYAGSYSGHYNTTGNFSCCFGFEAGKGTVAGVTANTNSFFGYKSGRGVTTGGNNSCFGGNTGTVISTGIYNSIFGTGAGIKITSGGFNTMFGASNGNDLTTGRNNVFIGYNAGDGYTTANNKFELRSDYYAIVQKLAYGDFGDSTFVHTGDVTIGGKLTVNGAYNYGGSEAGGDDDYVVTISGLTLQAGLIVTFLASDDNTGACTLNVNSLGAKAIKDQKGDDPADSYIDANSFVMVGYDGTNFVLLTPDANP